MQGLFVHLWQQQDPQKELSLPFLYRALTNRGLNFIRDRGNQARLLERQQPALRGAARVMPDDHTLSLQALTILSNSVQTEVFETLVYRFFDEMGQQEIADPMQVSRKTVQDRLDRAQAALGQIREEHSIQEAT